MASSTSVAPIQRKTIVVDGARNTASKLPIIDVKSNALLPLTSKHFASKASHTLAQAFVIDSMDVHTNHFSDLVSRGFVLGNGAGEWHKYADRYQQTNLQAIWSENTVPLDGEIRQEGYKSTAYNTYAPSNLMIEDQAQNPEGSLFPKICPVWFKENPDCVTQPFIWISHHDRNQVLCWLSTQNEQDPFLVRSMVQLFVSGQPIDRNSLRECGFQMQQHTTLGEIGVKPLDDNSHVYWVPGYTLKDMEGLNIQRVRPGFQYPPRSALSFLTVSQDRNKRADQMPTADSLRFAGFSQHHDPKFPDLWTRTTHVFNEDNEPITHIWIPNKTDTQMRDWHDQRKHLLPKNYVVSSYYPGSEIDRALNATGPYNRFEIKDTSVAPAYPKPHFFMGDDCTASTAIPLIGLRDQQPSEPNDNHSTTSSSSRSSDTKAEASDITTPSIPPTPSASPNVSDVWSPAEIDEPSLSGRVADAAVQTSPRGTPVQLTTMIRTVRTRGRTLLTPDYRQVPPMNAGRSSPLPFFPEYIAIEEITPKNAARTSPLPFFPEYIAMEETTPRNAARTSPLPFFPEYIAMEETTPRDAARTSPLAFFPEYIAIEETTLRDAARTSPLAFDPKFMPILETSPDKTQVRMSSTSFGAREYGDATKSGKPMRRSHLAFDLPPAQGGTFRLSGTPSTYTVASDYVYTDVPSGLASSLPKSQLQFDLGAPSRATAPLFGSRPIYQDGASKLQLTSSQKRQRDPKHK